MSLKRYLLLSLAALGLLAGQLPAAASLETADEPECPSVPAPELSFKDPLFIDKTRAGGEPVSVVGQDGSISVSAHAGTTHIYKNPEAAPGANDFLVGYTNQTLNWRSTDGGESWQYIGIPLLREGPHSATSTGFSDPDFAIDADGRIYNVEIDLANVSVFSSVDDGQSYTFANPMVTAGDRPWVTAGDKDEVFLYVNLPRQLWRSTNGGITWSPLPTPPVNSKIYNDPLNFDTGLIGPVGKDGIAISDDDGQTWTQFDGAGLGKDQNFFGVMAVDRAGNAYKAAAGGYGGSDDTTPDAEVTFNYFDRSKMEWGQTAVDIPIPQGDALWPWLTAGDDGRVAVVWYQSIAGEPDEFFIYAAYTNNGHGTTVTCSDGSTRFVPPQFTVVNASKRPIHVGKICLSGTTCNANPSFEGGDRRLGDFFTVNFDHEGNIFIASADTTLKNFLGGPKPVGNPIFIKQDAGDRILEQPDEIRKSRCLFPVPSCD